MIPGAGLERTGPRHISGGVDVYLQNQKQMFCFSLLFKNKETVLAKLAKTAICILHHPDTFNLNQIRSLMSVFSGTIQYFSFISLFLCLICRHNPCFNISHAWQTLHRPAMKTHTARPEHLRAAFNLINSVLWSVLFSNSPTLPSLLSRYRLSWLFLYTICGHSPCNYDNSHGPEHPSSSSSNSRAVSRSRPHRLRQPEKARRLLTFKIKSVLRSFQRISNTFRSFLIIVCIPSDHF